MLSHVVVHDSCNKKAYTPGLMYADAAVLLWAWPIMALQHSEGVDFVMISYMLAQVMQDT